MNHLAHRELLESPDDPLGLEAGGASSILREGGHPMVVHPIGVMRQEHVSHGAQIEKLATLAHQHRPPEEACNTWRALYAGTQRLTDDLMEHIHLENNLLFPRFEEAQAH